MKIDRLLGIVMHLLNRDIVSARSLAEKFEVSIRTIQRDINSLNMAGIPIVSIRGSSGGYGIIDSYKLDRQILNLDDFFFIIKALKGLSSAYESKNINYTLEKILSLFPEGKSLELDRLDSQLSIDFSVLREPPNIDKYLAHIRKAINTRKVIEFIYTNSNNKKSERMVEPLSLVFKWYAWYLFAFCQMRNDYRIFRISRIRDLKITDKDFNRVHHNIDELLHTHQVNEERSYLDIKLVCNPEIQVSVEEFFSNGKISELEDGSILVEISLPEDESFWLGKILSYGDKIKVLEPACLKEKILEKVKEIEQLYK